MRPAASRQPAPVRYARFDGPLGPMFATSDGEALTGLYFLCGQRDTPDIVSDWVEAPELAVFAALRAQLADYFAGRSAGFALPLAPAGTQFQRAVWDVLVSIEPGQTRSYGQVAQAIGRPSAVRAVGAAIGRNPISLIVPCHRVLGSDGSLTGYAGGLERKRALLALEGVAGRDPTGGNDR